MTIKDNSADMSGGGIVFINSNPILENIIITGNSADENGGGISCGYHASPSLINVTIIDNSAGWNGDGGGISCYYNSHPILMNCILWNNSPEEIYFEDFGLSNTITIAYSDIQGGETGIVTNNNGTVNWLEGNINEYPLFEDADCHLTENSPCIDAGNPELLYNDPEDPNNPGYALYPAMGTIINDMGAYGGPNASGCPPVFVEDNFINTLLNCNLFNNYPNPFNPSTTIKFSIQKKSQIELSIYNIKGQKIKTLAHNEFIKGSHSIIWNGNDESDKLVSSGVYLYKLNVNGKIQSVKKCLLLK